MASDPIDLAGYRNDRATSGQAAGLKGGGGSGTFDPMEARVSRLEDDSKDIKATLAEMRKDMVAIRVDLAELKGAVNAKPSFLQTFTLTVAVATLVSAAAYGGAASILPKLLGK